VAWLVVVAGVPVEVLVEVLVEEPLAYTVFHPSNTRMTTGALA